MRARFHPAPLGSFNWESFLKFVWEIKTHIILRVPLLLEAFRIGGEASAKAHFVLSAPMFLIISVIAFID